LGDSVGMGLSSTNEEIGGSAMRGFALAVVCVSVAFSFGQMVQAQPVDLSISTSEETYGPGDTLEVYVSLANSGAGFDAELYVAVEYFGTLLFLPSFTTDIVPLASGYLPGGFDISDLLVFSFPLDGGVPDDTYTLKAAILSASDYTIKSNIAQTDFTFESGGPPVIEGRNDYLPLAVGYEWRYRAEGAGDVDEGTMWVYDAEDDAGVYIFYLTDEEDDDPQIVVADDGGDIYLRQVISDGDSVMGPEEPGQLLLPADLEVGDEWTITVDYESFHITATVRAEGKESKSVPAGDFDDCWHLSISALFGLLSGNMWFAKDVGLIAGDISAPFLTGDVVLLDYELGD